LGWDHSGYAGSPKTSSSLIKEETLPKELLTLKGYLLFKSLGWDHSGYAGSPKTSSSLIKEEALPKELLMLTGYLLSRKKYSS